ncbi:HAD family hydrolase [Planctomicrobium piriforme]|uniref:Putative hydrolase of the HAD superfamily n=1 Tax=Planctomicrobium piriforme TaxID=1576369 RepID=A0A1I3I8Y9_9PLAN|nr:HAD family phosphatase [Planctomicrobium piriforme]SFI44297.1 putative hydrolase of the HAD superfamily [Planctomicrobium piriforme]
MTKSATNLPAGPLKTIVFDMGNVLVFFSHDRMCRQIGKLCGCSGDEMRVQLLESGLQWEFERGLIDEKILHMRLEEIFNCRIDLAALCRATADIFTLNDTIVPVLDELKHRGLRLVLLSNTCRTHVQFIREHWDFLDRFDQLVVSYEVGAIKPEDAMYRAALNAIECRPEEALYTDDIAPYVAKGRSFGLNAAVFTTTEKFLADLRDYGIEIDAPGCRDSEYPGRSVSS